jgi:peptide/nickel transport system permease protein
LIGYILRRLAETAALLVLLSFAFVWLIGLMPGDPFDLMLAADPNVTAADVARLKSVYGLDGGLLERWWGWLRRVLAGDFGYSRLYALPALEVLGPRLVNTLVLMGLSLALALLLAVPAGIAAALDPDGPIDHVVSFLALAGYSVPSFWLGLLLIILFAVELQWLPAGGVGSIGGGDLLDRLRYLLLPVLTLTLLTAGTFVRFVRGAMIDALREPFIRTARAKGAGTWGVVRRHALRHAMPTLVTVLALQLGGIFSGAVVVETIFAYLGVGKLIYDSIMGNDYNLALLALMLATLMTLAANLLADLAYAWLDPRVTYAE